MASPEACIWVCQSHRQAGSTHITESQKPLTLSASGESMFSFLGKCQNISPSGCTILCSQRQCLSDPGPALGVVRLGSALHFCGCAAVAAVAQSAFPLWLMVLAIFSLTLHRQCISSSMKRLFPSAVFLLDSFLMLNFGFSLYSKFWYCIGDLVCRHLLSVVCLFILLMEPFTEQKFWFWQSPVYQLFLRWVILFLPSLRTLCPAPDPEDNDVIS